MSPFGHSGRRPNNLSSFFLTVSTDVPHSLAFWWTRLRPMVICYLHQNIATRPAMEANAVGSAELRSRFATLGRGTKVPIETAQMISIIWSVPSERTIAFAQERICLVSLSLGTPWVAIQFLV